VIPAFDEPDVIGTLESLLNCEPPTQPVEVILAINYGENVEAELKEKAQTQYEQTKIWMAANERTDLEMNVLLLKELPKKHAGVGLARKIGMDEACYRFESIANGEGVIVCLDADCQVSKNYLIEIVNHYKQYPECIAANVYFEHPLDKEYQEHILNYELHLRYYIEGLRQANYPFAFHTIGSTITVRHKTYQQQGGMNKRKAGEDFYFLHKVIPLGNFQEINEATVYPDARISHRVPFGTGRAIWEADTQQKNLQVSYHYESFLILKKLFEAVPEMFDKDLAEVDMPAILKNYLTEHIDFQKDIKSILKNTAGRESFVKRMHRYWDGITVLKLVHYLRDEKYKVQELTTACRSLLKLDEQFDTTEKLLLHLRSKQKKSRQ